MGSLGCGEGCLVADRLPLKFICFDVVRAKLPGPRRQGSQVSFSSDPVKLEAVIVIVTADVDSDPLAPVFVRLSHHKTTFVLSFS